MFATVALSITVGLGIIAIIIMAVAFSAVYIGMRKDLSTSSRFRSGIGTTLPPSKVISDVNLEGPLPSEFNVAIAGLLLEASKSMLHRSGHDHDKFNLGTFLEASGMGGIVVPGPGLGIYRTVPGLTGKLKRISLKYQKEHPAVRIYRLTSHAKTAIMSFRGNGGRGDMSGELSRFRTPIRPTWLRKNKWPGMRVHEGFLRQYATIRDDVLAHSKRFKRILITGYSSGSMMAILAALDIAEQCRGHQTYTVGFAGANMGNADLGRAFDEAKQMGKATVFKVNNQADLVAHIPLAAIPNFRGMQSELLHYIPCCPVISFYASDDTSTLMDGHAIQHVQKALESGKWGQVDPMRNAPIGPEGKVMMGGTFE